MAIAGSNEKYRGSSPLNALRGRVKAARTSAQTFASVRMAPLRITVVIVMSLALGGYVMWQHDRGTEVITAVNGAVLDKQMLFDRLQTMSGSAAVQQLTDEELMLQYAGSQHIFPSEAQVAARYAEMRKLPDFELQLTKSSPESIKRSIRLSMVQMMLLGENVTVTDAEIFQYYQTQTDKNNPKARYYQPPNVTIQVVVTNTEEACNKAFHALVDGLPFGVVAQTYSIDTSKQNMGMLSPIHRGQTRGLAPDFEEAIFGMRVGSRIGPKHFYGKWWLIRCLDRNIGINMPFGAVREECRLSALAQKGAPVNAPRIRAELAAFKAKAKYQAFWPAYSDAWKSN